MYFVGLNSDLYFVVITAVMYSISSYIRPHYITTLNCTCYCHTCIVYWWYDTTQWQILVSVATNVPGYCIALLLVVGVTCTVCKWTTQTMEYCLVMSHCGLTPYSRDNMIHRHVSRIQSYVNCSSQKSRNILFLYGYNAYPSRSYISIRKSNYMAYYQVKFAKLFGELECSGLW